MSIEILTRTKAALSACRKFQRVLDEQILIPEDEEAIKAIEELKKITENIKLDYLNIIEKYEK